VYHQCAADELEKLRAKLEGVQKELRNAAEALGAASKTMGLLETENSLEKQLKVKDDEIDELKKKLALLVFCVCLYHVFCVSISV